MKSSNKKKPLLVKITEPIVEPILKIVFEPRDAIIPLFLVLILEYLNPSFYWNYIINFESILITWGQVYLLAVMLFICLIIRVVLFEKREKKENKANKKVPYVGSKIFLPEMTKVEKVGWYAKKISWFLIPITIILSLVSWIVLVIKILQFF